MKRISLFISTVLLSLLPYQLVFACVGARPLAMGGAFVGVADDVDAVYWNPGGLGLLRKPQLTYTGMIAERDEINYDDYFGFLYPLVFGDSIYGTIGSMFMHNIDRSKATVGSLSLSAEIDENWQVFSYGLELFKGFGIGVNARWLEQDLELKAQATIGSTTYAVRATDGDDLWGFDLGIYYKWDKFSIGLLAQDVNEPKLALFGQKTQYIRNIRLGFAFYPTSKSILSFELYDTTGETRGGVSDVSQDIRLGAEYWLNDWLALRAGGYHINSSDKSNRAITFGFGYKTIFETFSKADKPWPLHINLDYGLMYWTDPSDGNTNLTHMLGLKISVPWSLPKKKPPDKKQEVKELIIEKIEKEKSSVQAMEKVDIKEFEEEITKDFSFNKDTYFEFIRGIFLKNLYFSADIKTDMDINIIFTISSNGELKKILISGKESENPIIQNAINRAIRGIFPLPEFPRDIEKDEMQLNLPVKFLPQA